MKKIFWGLLFLLVEIKLGRLPITPLVGYLLIWCGLGEVPERETFRRTGKVAAVTKFMNTHIWIYGLQFFAALYNHIAKMVIG